MDEDFVKGVLGKAMGGLIDMHDINEIWRVYKDHVKEMHPELYALIELDEYTMRKMFLCSIDMFMAIPKFLVFAGMQQKDAAMAMYTLEHSMKREYLKILVGEGKTK